MCIRDRGSRAPGLLLALGPAERSGRTAIDCSLAAQLLAEVARLPVAERRLALRLMYGHS